MDHSLPSRLNGGPYIFGYLDDTDPEADLIKLGNVLDPGSSVYGPYHFSSDVFDMHHYCWCGDEFRCNYCCYENPLPNFWYKPSDLRLYWYKWILRDPTSNRECSPAEWREIMDHCAKVAHSVTRQERFRRNNTPPWG